MVNGILVKKIQIKCFICFNCLDVVNNTNFLNKKEVKKLIVFGIFISILEHLGIIMIYINLNSFLGFTILDIWLIVILILFCPIFIVINLILIKLKIIKLKIIKLDGINV